MTVDIEKARALVETLKDYAEHPSSFTDISPTEADAAADLIDALIAEVRDREDVLERAIREAVLAEREACASLIEPKNPRSDWTEYAEAKADCAAMIRARGAA